MDSLNSCLQNQEEESGWTAYFEDFSEHQQLEYSSYSSHGTSMVSDAASRANHNLAEPTVLKKLRLKKTRTKEIWHDDSLEDTASSPVNSPKVSDAMNPRTQEDHRINISLGKRFEPGVVEMDHTRSDHGRHTINYNTDNDDDRLKKKGLCLVPMSMLVNYFG